MKRERHEVVVDLINKYDIETQEELAAYLRKEGYEVTQATVSRDIRELHLSKIAAGGGRQKYIILQNEDNRLGDKYIRVLREGFVSMSMAQNILVIKTVQGMAMAVAAAVDAMRFSEIVGCIAGDDTIFAAVKSVEETKTVMQKLDEIVKGYGRNNVSELTCKESGSDLGDRGNVWRGTQYPEWRDWSRQIHHHRLH